MEASGDPPPWARLGELLDRAVERNSATEGGCCVLFSGGIDSGLIADAAARFGGATGITVGVESSEDVRWVRCLPPGWPSGSTIRIVTHAEVRATAELVGPLLDGASPLERSVAISLAVALQSSTRERVLCGQGADELFLGYAHFRGLSPAAALARSASDLSSLVDREWPRSCRIASALGRDLRAPFLDPEVIAESQRIPIEQRLPGVETKGLLRSLARARGLPELICGRPKKALQYGTGFDRLIRRAEPVPR
ncbi:MAG: asparagine synthase C-terminal domain-containing protein [Thermoplasmata archaeon]|nr:asparagine synthase C-terminal domain-containing protein [Thermoplasmata archaeon]